MQWSEVGLEREWMEEEGNFEGLGGRLFVLGRGFVGALSGRRTDT